MGSLGVAFALGLCVWTGLADLDCGRPADASAQISRLRLAELEYAEDVHREAHWSALGRCGGGPASDGCRQAETRRHDATWRETRAAIDAKYRRMREAYEERCRAAISRAPPGP